MHDQFGAAQGAQGQPGLCKQDFDVGRGAQIKSKAHSLGWRDGLAVKSVSCPSRRPELGSQIPYQSLTNTRNSPCTLAVEHLASMYTIPW